MFFISVNQRNTLMSIIYLNIVIEIALSENCQIASLLALSFKSLVSDVLSGYVDSQGYRWKKSPPKTDAPRPSETTTSTANLNQSSYNPTQPDVIQIAPEGEPAQYEAVQPTPVQEALATEKPLFPSQPVSVQDEELAMTEKPVYQTKPSVDLKPVNDLVSDLNHLLDGLKDKEEEEKEENCVLKKNLEGCDIYLCSMIRSLLAVPFPDCYAVKSFYRMLDM